MTFFICLFIVMMQFLWKYIDELVGKGLSIDVITELFFYAALSMIPLALPLSILLSSLMTFGDLGENFELTAMKASGISLLKVMKPLIVLVALIAVGAFFFQNNVLPVSQVKMWTLLYSVRQKSPELEIPEGVFYDQIPGYNLFVQSKNRETGTLYDLMIYDFSKGFDNAAVILADSGRLASTEDKANLIISLWSGEQFENLREQRRNVNSVPYRRESFQFKKILMKFDANFNRLDEDGMRNQYVGKNITELRATIDSVNHRIDSIGTIYGSDLRVYPFMNIVAEEVSVNHSSPQPRVSNSDRALPDDHDVQAANHAPQRKMRYMELTKPMNVDSIFHSSTSGRALSYLNQALVKARRNQGDYHYKGIVMDDDRYTIRRHEIELIRKFTLSFACIVFFFIGAPLGAIIRKGGLGMPLVISVFLFIFYYIIDNTGYKLARDGKLEVWIGIWLSSAVLLPLGVFFTYKAMRDSAVFNADAYRAFFRRLFGLRETRTVAMKEVLIISITPEESDEIIKGLDSRASEIITRVPEIIGFSAYWKGLVTRGELTALSESLEAAVEYFSNTLSLKLLNALSSLPVIVWNYLYNPLGNSRLLIVAKILFPISYPIYLIGRRKLRALRQEAEEVKKFAENVPALLKER